jgi:predicted translin family RNA/ssDNA-binding protein
MEKNIDYKKEFDLACEKLAKQEKKIEKLKEELAHYKNTEAIQKSNNASRYNPYNHKSYVDREFNVIP